MKKTFILLIAMLSLAKGYSQNVGIGTNNPLNKLHVAGGFRLDTLVGVAGSGILQHNGNGVVSSLKFNGNVEDVLRGNGTFGISTAWTLHGNAGTNPSTNFIGTTDEQPLLFRMKNQPSGLIDSASGNTAFGFKNLALNTSGFGNTTSGSLAMSHNTTGYYNTAIGSYSLYRNTTGYFNTGTGISALQGNTTGHSNTANGSLALYNNQTGNNNTANGYYALYYNTAGNSNTANGVYAIHYNTTGNNNTANGYYALYANITGQGNSANGYYALNANTTGFYNTASGIGGLYLNTTGNYNTASGSDALYSNTTGNFNTALGYNADVSTGALTNATAIGYSALVNASNKIRLGNAAVTVIEGQVAFTHPSDGRFKTNISENVKGLDFIMKLRPIVYNFQTKKYEEFLKGETVKDAKIAAGIDYTESEKIRHNGFIAQEVEKAAKETGYEFDGVVAPKNDKEAYGLSYSQFVVPLVKAVQELNANNKGQEQMIEGLKSANETLKNESVIQKNINADLQKQIDELKALIKK